MFFRIKFLLILIAFLTHQIRYIQSCSCSNQPIHQMCKSKFAAFVIIRSGPFRLNASNLSVSLTNHLNHITHRMLQNESSNLLPGLDTTIYYYKAEINHPLKLGDGKYRENRRIRIWIHHQPGNSCNAKLKLNQQYLVWSNLSEENEPRVNLCNAIPYEHIKLSNRDLLNKLLATGLRCR